MFRTGLMVMLASLSAAGYAAAEEGSSAGSVGPAVIPSSQNEALEIMREHMRSQLDWRSYFTNRMDARRRARSSGQKMSQEPRAASTE
jgi:hypothetical protein